MKRWGRNTSGYWWMVSTTDVNCFTSPGLFFVCVFLRWLVLSVAIKTTPEKLIPTIVFLVFIMLEMVVEGKGKESSTYAADMNFPRKLLRKWSWAKAAGPLQLCNSSALRAKPLSCWTNFTKLIWLKTNCKLLEQKGGQYRRNHI